MKHVKKFEGFKSKSEENINESVFQVENTYKVNLIIEVEQKFLSAYSKKVKQNTNKDTSDFMSTPQLAEEVVKWVVKEGMDVEKIPANAIIGGAQAQAQAQPQAQEEVQIQDPGESQAQVQIQDPGESQAQIQISDNGMEDVDDSDVEDLPI